MLGTQKTSTRFI